ncbi:MAG: 1-acyl-sn-glycerol-3-phosphate acyltransferase [Actinobacteria bacterium]|nr:1-acyl-sn-glycerol-3-phosphate acyltransferase [Actinomycetota bacterium]
MSAINRKDKSFLWWLVAFLLRPLMTLLTKRDWRNADRVNIDSGIIFAGNHISWFDPFPVAHFMWANNRPPIYLGKESVFKVALLGSLLRGLDQIPVKRNTEDAAQSLSIAIDRINSGEAVVIYPEGTISRDPNLWPMKGKTGAIRLALLTGAPLIPFAQWGAQEVIPPYKTKLRLIPRKTMQVNVGLPIDLTRYQGKPITDELLASATDELMQQISNLLAELRNAQAPKIRKSKDEWLAELD